MKNSAFVVAAPRFPLPANRPLHCASVLAGVLAAAGLLLGSGAARADNIKSLPVTITKPGTYNVNQDLVCSAGGNAIMISADNVTLDLKGHVILGPQTGGSFTSTGVYVGAQQNVVVENGTITGFSNGVWFQGTSSSQVTGISATGAFNTGVTLISANGNTISGCNLSHNLANGVWSGNSASTITNNTASGNGFSGISLTNGSTQNMVQGNTTNLNGSFGILISQSTQNTLQGNTALGNGTDFLDGNGNCSSNTWLGNTFRIINPSCIQ